MVNVVLKRFMVAGSGWQLALETDYVFCLLSSIVYSKNECQTSSVESSNTSEDDPQSEQALLRIPSLVIGIARPGDLVFRHAGTITCELFLNEMNAACACLWLVVGNRVNRLVDGAGGRVGECITFVSFETATIR